MFDVSKAKFTVTAVLKTGGTLDLTNLLMDASLEEGNSEIAQRFTFDISNTKIAQGYLNGVIALCTNILVQCNGTEIFQGVVWESDYESSLTKTLSVVCYDKMIYTQKSKDNFYFTKGKTTGGIIGEICAKWGIPLVYNWLNHTHEKFISKNKTICDSIVTALNDAAKKLGNSYVARMKQGTLYIEKKGSNQDVYVFTVADNNVVSTRHKASLDDLVTKVIIVGKEDKEGMSPIIETVNGDTQYGVLQEIVSCTDNAKVADAKQEAQELLNKRGQPEHTIYIDSLDVPFLRKGDKIKVAAGDLIGYFYVTSVTHNIKTRLMRMEVEAV